MAGFASCALQDVEHLLVRGQRPQIVGHHAFQLVGGGAHRVHRRQQRFLGVRRPRRAPSPPSGRSADLQCGQRRCRDRRSSPETSSSVAVLGSDTDRLRLATFWRQLGLVAQRRRQDDRVADLQRQPGLDRDRSARTARARSRSGCASRGRLNTPYLLEQLHRLLGLISSGRASRVVLRFGKPRSAASICHSPSSRRR